MIKNMHIRNLTVFPDVKLDFGKNLNVILGENGAGKTHLLKMAYCVMATSWEEGRKPNASNPTKTTLQSRLADKLVNVFRPESLGRLARRKQGRERCDIELNYFQPGLDIAFGFATNSKTEVSIETLPEKWLNAASVYLPTRELLTIFPNFVATYEGHYLEFEETWRDTCLLLGAPLKKGPIEHRIKDLLEPLEIAMQGSIELDKTGRFYLNNSSGRMEIPLVAEGLRKLGMLSRLIATGALLDKGCLFWDEPEANLNPRLVKQLAKTIVELSTCGTQVFVATHSLFMLREIEIVLSDYKTNCPETRFFGLHPGADGVTLQQGTTVDDIGDIVSLEESLLQSDRYMDMVN